MIALLFVGGVVYAGAFSGFVVETEASSCCGGETTTCDGGTDGFTFSSSECCEEEECNICGCYVEGCSDCLYSFIGCGSDENGDSCDCSGGGGGELGTDGCQDMCPATTDLDYLCNNDCSY